MYKTCICGVLDCPFGNDVNCAEVMPWMWKEIMEEESDAAGCGCAGNAKSAS